MRIHDRRKALTTIVLLALSTSAQAQDASERLRGPEVVASAGAERGVAADLATVTLRFSSTDRTTASAGQQVALKADSLRDGLEDLGIPGDSIVTASRWGWWRDRVKVIPGPIYMDRETRAQLQDTTYQVFEQFEVRVHELELLGQIIDLALAKGITEISGIRFSATDTEAAHQEALQEATQKARARAEAIAGASGGRIGRLLQLSTEPFGIMPRYGYRGVAMAAIGVEEAGVRTAVVPPSIGVSAVVYGRWEFMED